MKGREADAAPRRGSKEQLLDEAKRGQPQRRPPQAAAPARQPEPEVEEGEGRGLCRQLGVALLACLGLVGVLAWVVMGRVLSLQTLAPPPLLSALAWGGLVGCLAAAAPCGLGPLLREELDHGYIGIESSLLDVPILCAAVLLGVVASGGWAGSSNLRVDAQTGEARHSRRGASLAPLALAVLHAGAMVYKSTVLIDRSAGGSASGSDAAGVGGCRPTGGAAISALLWISALVPFLSFVWSARLWLSVTPERLLATERLLLERRVAGRSFRQTVVAGLGTLEAGPGDSQSAVDDSVPASSSGKASNGVIVLIHGFGAGNGLWCENLRTLSANHRLLCVEWRGCGRSKRPRFTASNYSDTVEWFIPAFERWREEIGLHQPFTPDIAGDYIIGRCSSSRPLAVGARTMRVAAMDFAATGNKSLRATLLEDHFDSWSVASTDTVFDAWQTADGRLVARELLNWNAQPLDFRLRGLSVNSTHVFELGLQYDVGLASRQGEGLFLTVIGGPTASVALSINGSSQCSRGTRCTLVSRALPHCESYSLSLFVTGTWSAGNASVTACCRSGSPSAVAFSVPHKLPLSQAPTSDFGIPSGDVKLSLSAAAAIQTTTPCAVRESSDGVLVLGVCAALRSISVQSGFDARTLPRVLGDTSDWLPVERVNLGPAHTENFRVGILDVTLPPFSADATGATDSTVALQRAIDFAYRHYLVVFLRTGRYLVSQTLNATQYNRFGSMGNRFGAIAIRGELHASEPAARATLFLADDSPGFTSLSNGTRPVLNMWHERTTTSPSGDQDLGSTQANINMNLFASSFNIDLGARNYGAVGCVNRGAQGASLQGLIIYARDGFAGIQGGAGSGGSHLNTVVIGGKFGLDFRGTQPAATVAGFRLSDQSCGGVLYSGLMTLSIVGLELRTDSPSSNFKALIAETGSCPYDFRHGGGTCGQGYAHSEGGADCAIPPLGWCLHGGHPAATKGQVTIVDSTLDGGSGGDRAHAISSTSNMLYIRNTQVRGFRSLATFNVSQHEQPLPSSFNPGQWTTINELVHGETPPAFHYKPSHTDEQVVQLHAPVVIDGKRSTDDIVNISAAQSPLPLQSPAALRERHSYGQEATFPSFETPGAIDATDAPYSAKGDGVSDSAASINAALQAAAKIKRGVVWLPKGVYRLSATLLVPQGVSLVGTSHRLVLLVPTRGRSAALTAPEPLVRMLGPASARKSEGEIPGSTLAHVMLGTVQHQTNVLAWEWQAEGDENVAREISTWIFQPVCPQQIEPSKCPYPSSRPAPPWKHQPGFNTAMTTLTGSGRFFVTHHEDGWHEGVGYRHLLITGSPQAQGRRAFYHLNPEHAQSDANVEVANTSGVEIYGLKSEGLFAVMWLRNASDVRLYGFGGNACPMGAYPEGFAEFKPSLFRIEDSTGVDLACLTSYEMSSTLALGAVDVLSDPGGTGCTGSFCACLPPDEWVTVVERRNAGEDEATRILDRPVLWRRTSRRLIAKTDDNTVAELAATSDDVVGASRVLYDASPSLGAGGGASVLHLGGKATCAQDCTGACRVRWSFQHDSGRFSAICSDPSRYHGPDTIALHAGIVLKEARPVQWNVPGDSNLEGLAEVGAILLQQGTNMEVTGPPSATCPRHKECPSDGSCPCARAGSVCESENLGCAEVRARFELTGNSGLTLSHVAINGQSAVDRHKQLDGAAAFPAPDGGALIVKQGCEAVLTNVEIVGNSAFEQDNGSGGAIYIEPGATLKVTGSLIAGNHAHEHGGGIWINGDDYPPPSITITKTIFCGNVDTTQDDRGNGIFWNYYAKHVNAVENNCMGNPSIGTPYQAHCWPEKSSDTCSAISLTCSTWRGMLRCNTVIPAPPPPPPAPSPPTPPSPGPGDHHIGPAWAEDVEEYWWVGALLAVVFLGITILCCCSKRGDSSTSSGNGFSARVSTFEGFYARMGDATSIHGLDSTRVSSLRDAVAYITGPTKAALAAGCKSAEAAADRLLDSGPDPHDLTRDEIAAIHLYTQEVMYRPLNRALWSQRRGDVKPYWGYIRLLQQALFKIPKCDAGNIYRGIKDPYEPITEADMLAIATESSPAHPNGGTGQEIIWWGFSSCSTNQQPVMNFLGQDGVRVLYTIEGGSSARNVRNYSAFKEEDEVLMPFGAAFTVVTASAPSPDLLLVTLRQTYNFALGGQGEADPDAAAIGGAE